MSDLEKAKFLLKVLSKQKLELEGAREAFFFTESYNWLLQMAKTIQEEKDKNGNK